MRVVKTLSCAAALVALLAPGARADEWNKKTILTFSGPVQIPGATLPGGTYVFKLADLQSNRHVIQVFDKDEKKIYGTILAIPDQRLEPSDKPVVLFSERPAGTPQAVRAWFYPGDTIGNEFVYPKAQAMKIAKETHQSVLAMDEDTKSTTDEQRMDSMKSAKVSRVDENGQASDMSSNTQASAQPGTASASAASSTASGTATGTTSTAADRPTTGSTASGTAASTTSASNDARLKNGSGEAARTRSNTASTRSNTAGANAKRNPSNAAVGTSGQTANQTADNANGRTRSGRRSLPRTASNLAMVELLSGLSLLGALGIRRVRARLAESL